MQPGGMLCVGCVAMCNTTGRGAIWRGYAVSVMGMEPDRERGTVVRGRGYITIGMAGLCRRGGNFDRGIAIAT